LALNCWAMGQRSASLNQMVRT